MIKIDKKTLKNLTPFKNLSADKLNEIINKSKIEDLPASRVLFRAGDHDKLTYFLLNGQLELTSPGNSHPTIIKAKTATANSAIEQLIPRISTARTKTAVTLLSIDTDLLDILTADDSSLISYEVTELNVSDIEDDSSDWMLRFLQSKAFLNLPTENIQKLLMQMTEVEYKKDDIIVKQGSQDNYYYIIKSGKCEVTRRPAPKVKEVKLANLKVGDGFGEEALITNGKRNANVTMSEDGSLMRLSKDDFNSLLVQPLLDYVDEETANNLITSGARLIDVRGKNEFKSNAIDGAINIPLSMLRNRATSLNPSRKYVVYCDSGNRSAAAAFLMCQLGFQCFIIESGMNSCDSELIHKDITLANNAASGSQSLEMGETKSLIPEQIITNLEDIIETQSLNLSDVKTEQNIPQLTNIEIPTLNDDEIDLIKSKAEQEFSEKLERERQTAIKKAEQIERDYQQKLKSERLKSAQNQQEIKQAQNKIQSNYKDKLDQERNKTLQAENHSKNALQEIERIKKEALVIREHSQTELDRYKNEIKQEHNRVEKELIKSKQDTEIRLKAEKIIFEKQQKAELEVQLAKKQISNIKLETDSEVEKLRKELAQSKKEQRNLEQQKELAEQQFRDINLQINDVRTEAQIDKEKIQQEKDRAQKQKQKLQDQLIKHQVESELQLKQNIDSATKTQNETEQAVERLRIELEEKTKQNLKLENQEHKAKELAKKLSLEAEESRLSAEMEAAHFRAEADLIREQAKVEANKLKNEIDSSRLLMEEQAKIAQAEAEQASQIRRHAEQEKLLFEHEQEKSNKIKLEEADARKRVEIEIEEAKQILARESELARREKAEAEAFERARLESEQLAKRNVEEANKRSEQRAIQLEKEEADEKERQLAQLRAQERINAAARKAEYAAKQRAAQIAATLKKKAITRRDIELQADIQSDISLAKASIVEKNGRIVLEGENDIFIFQRPEPEEIIFEEVEDDSSSDSAANIPVLETIDKMPNSSAAIDTDANLFDFDHEFDQPNNSSSQIIINEPENEQASDQLPSSNQQTTFNPTDSVALTSDAFLQTNISDKSGTFTSYQTRSIRKIQKNKTFTIITTSIVVLIAIGIFAVTNETYFNFDKVLAWLEPDQQIIVEETETRRLARIAAAQSRAELSVKEKAAFEFKTMLEKWKDSVELGPSN